MEKALKEITSGLNHAWQNVAEGWRELVNRGSSALTKFIPHKNDAKQDKSGLRSFSLPRWSLLAGDVIEREKSIVVQIELPGIAREDCDITIVDNTLRIRGEKRMDREYGGDSFYVMQRAYGSFERHIPLPVDVDADSSRATLRDGVLKVELKKQQSTLRRLISVK